MEHTNACENTAAGGAARPTPRGPLDGVRILDLSSVVMGPWATQTLGDMGADVICVEAAGGDALRFLGPSPHTYLSGVALNVLRNKRNIALNLKNPAGRKAFLDIASTCDVLVTNLRPGPRARLGLAYEDLRQVRPDIIYCHAQGWSTASGRSDDPAYDDVVQAASGMAAVFAMQHGKPTIAPVPVADQIGSLTIVQSVLAALYHRAKTGEGQKIEVPMIDVMAAFVMVIHGKDAMLEPPLGPPGYGRMTSPLRAPLPTKNGYVQLVLYTRENWRDFFTTGGVEGADSDPRLTTPHDRNQFYAELYSEMAEILLTRTTAEWIEWCDAHGVACSPVVALETLIEAYPLAQHPLAGCYRQIPIPVQFSLTPGGVRREAPIPGEHNAEILAEAGYSAEDIAKLTLNGGLVTAEMEPK